MLNIIWPIFIIVSYVYACFSGNLEKINNGIFESTKSAVELCLTFLRNTDFVVWYYANCEKKLFIKKDIKYS